MLKPKGSIYTRQYAAAFVKQCTLSHEEEEEGTGIASDVVKVEGEDPVTPGLLP